jgi:enterochelin esterase-like enzyme
MDRRWEIGSWTDVWRIAQFRSAAVGAGVSFYIYLPPGYESGNDPYPVVYWLHRAFGRPYSATPIVKRLDAAVRAGRATEMIVVSCIDPTGLSMWTNSKDGRIPMENVIIEELIPRIDSTYRTIAGRPGRAIEGFSMGGYGAAYLGVKYRQLFSSISVLSGALHTAETLQEQRRSIFFNVYSDDITYATECSPWKIIERWADEIRDNMKMRVFVGADDDLREWNTNYHSLLDELAIPHEWGVVPECPHDLETMMKNWQGDFFAYYKDLFAGADSQNK